MNPASSPRPEKRILAGDIGGTTSRLALFRGSPDDPEPLARRTYRNREFSRLADVVRRFQTETGLPAARACFGVAGAVVAGESTLPNLSWRLSEPGLAADLGLQSVRLINDLEANAHGIATLVPEQFFVLNPGQARPGGNRALIAAGTGLGMAMLIPEGRGWRVCASEGGHADFAPRTEDEAGLWRFLANRYGRVSVERVVSGPGLVNIYAYLTEREFETTQRLARQLSTALDPAAVIAEAGMVGEEEICVEALGMFLDAYGAAAGNLALTALATGGLDIGGGIAPKLLAGFSAGGFMAAFTNKGRFADLLKDIPVRIIREPDTALRGAARVALMG